MTSRALATILQELGSSTLIPIPDLHPDRNNACVINLPMGIKIHLELDSKEEHLTVGTVLGTLQGGRYQENFFREALKANGLPHPRYGTFAYSSKTSSLILQEALHLQELSGEKLAAYLEKFLEKALIWKQALEGGNIPEVSTKRSLGMGNLFGLKH
jgi:hypothetical protein